MAEQTTAISYRHLKDIMEELQNVAYKPFKL